MCTCGCKRKRWTIPQSVKLDGGKVVTGGPHQAGHVYVRRCIVALKGYDKSWKKGFGASSIANLPGFEFPRVVITCMCDPSPVLVVMR